MAPNLAEKIHLPALVYSPADIGRLTNELETIDNEQLEQKIRSKADHRQAELHASKPMSELFTINKLDLLNDTNRQTVHQFLDHIKRTAPVLHISFNDNPPQRFMSQLVDYLRREIHPLVLVTVGLQPSVVAGCVIRSTNKYFDLSLRKDLESKSAQLIEQLNIADKMPPANAPVAPNTEKVVQQ